MVRGYESLIIAHPETSDEGIQSIIDKISQLILKREGEVLKAEKLGKRKLVYKIKGSLRGQMLIVYFRGQPRILQELDGLLRYDEQVLRYQTIRLDDKFDLEIPRKEGTLESAEDSLAQESDEVTKQEAAAKSIVQEPTEELTS